MAIAKKLKKFSFETRLKSSDQFKDRVLGMFKGYIKAIIIFGAIVRGDITGKSDVDVYIIFDDTKMPLKKFEEIREKIDNDIYKVANQTDPRLHTQPVIALTEFWDGIRNCHPLFYTIVRDGYAIHDTGFFIPLRKLLEWGKFPATPEAAELRMESVPKRISRVKNIKNLMIAEDLWYAAIDAGQAALMYVGVGPPAPKVLAREMRKNLVEPGLLEEKYAKFVEDVHNFRKAVEHKEKSGSISGKELDEWIERADDYVKRIEKLLENARSKNKETDIKKSYEVMIKASLAALKSIGENPPEPGKLIEVFDKKLVETKLVNPVYKDVLMNVIKARKMFDDKNLDKVSEREVSMNKEYVRRFVSDIRGILEKPSAEKKIEEAKEIIETAKESKKLAAKPASEKNVEKIEKKLRKAKPKKNSPP